MAAINFGHNVVITLVCQSRSRIRHSRTSPDRVQNGPPDGHLAVMNRRSSETRCTVSAPEADTVTVAFKRRDRRPWNGPAYPPVPCTARTSLLAEPASVPLRRLRRAGVASAGNRSSNWTFRVVTCPASVAGARLPLASARRSTPSRLFVVRRRRSRSPPSGGAGVAAPQPTSELSSLSRDA